MLTHSFPRLGWLVVTWFGTSLGVCLLLNALPGDVARIALASGMAIVLTLPGSNLLGQGLQKVLDPKRLQ